MDLGKAWSSLNLLWNREKYKRFIEAYHFISWDVATSMSGYNVQYSKCMMFILYYVRIYIFSWK